VAGRERPAYSYPSDSKQD